MSRRSSAFDDDLAGLDELARLPLPPTPGSRGNDDDAAGGPPDAAAGSPVPSAATAAPLVPEMPAVDMEVPVDSRRLGSSTVTPDPPTPDPTETSGLPSAAGEGAPARRPSTTVPDGPAADRRSSTTQTAVRLSMPVAKWLSEQANRQQLTFSSVIVQAVLAHRDELAPELSPGDGLVVKRRPRTHSAPVTLRLTPAQRELIDGLAQEFSCTRSALVLAALQAAMAPPDRGNSPLG